MSSTFSSRTYNFNTLLGRSSFPDYTTKQVAVPRFQRGFSWQKSHVATFWEDVLDFHNKGGSKDTYFLGPIVILPGDESIGVLDGQQRLATATILLAAIRDMARQKGGQKGADLARDIQRDNILVDDEEERFALILSEHDKLYFESHIQTDPPALDQSAKVRSHRLIRQAANFLRTSLQELFEDNTSAELVQNLKKLKTTVVERLKLVVIEVESEEEAYQIFETLNDRGLRLSTPDLLLNYLMQTAKNDSERDKVYKHWAAVLETVGTDKVSTFLRHMWVSRYGDVKSQGLYREIRSKVKDSVQTSSSFAKECADECSKYYNIVQVKKEALKRAEQPVRALVKHLNADKAFPALLSGLNCLDENEFEKLSNHLVSIVVRHSLIANLNPSVLEDTLYAVARMIRDKKDSGSSSKKILQEVKRLLQKIDPTKDQIRNGLGEVFLNQKQSQYILNEIGNQIQSKTKAIELAKTSVEHIFPQNAENSDWPNYKSLAEMIWHLGNLTLLEPKINKDLGNIGFTEKKKFYAKSEVTMNNALAAINEEWSEDSIKERAVGFLNHVEAAWRIN